MSKKFKQITALLLILVGSTLVNNIVEAAVLPNNQLSKSSSQQFLSARVKQATQEIHQGLMTTDPDTVAAVASLGEKPVNSSVISTLSSPNAGGGSVSSNWQTTENTSNNLAVDPDAIAAEQAMQQIPQQPIDKNSSTSVSPGQPS